MKTCLALRPSMQGAAHARQAAARPSGLAGQAGCSRGRCEMLWGEGPAVSDAYTTKRARRPMVEDTGTRSAEATEGGRGRTRANEAMTGRGR